MIPLAPPVAPSIRLEALYSEAANLAYGLDAVSGGLGAGEAEGQRGLWEARFLKTDADREAVEEWGAVKARYARGVDLPSPPMPLLARVESLSIADAMQGVELGSRSVEETARRLGDFVPLADVARLRAVLTRFQGPYHRWWTEVAAPQGGPFAKAMRARLADPGLAREVSRFAAFYGADLPAGTLGRFSLVFRADAGGTISGRQLQGIAAVEFHAGDRPEDRVGTLVHEFCHLLYNARPAGADAALQARFVASGDPGAKPALNLMNETLATTLGNGVVGRRYAGPERWARLLATPRSLYNDDAIDRASKRLLPAMDAYLAAGGTMNGAEFARLYLGAITAEFGDALLRPSGMLKEAYVFTDSRFGAGFSRRAVRAMRIAGAYRNEGGRVDEEALAEFAAQPHLSGLFVVAPDRLGEMVARGVLSSEDAAALRGALVGRPGAVLGRPRTAFASVYVVVANDADAALEGLKTLEARETPLAGLLP